MGGSGHYLFIHIFTSKLLTSLLRLEKCLRPFPFKHTRKLMSNLPTEKTGTSPIPLWQQTGQGDSHQKHSGRFLQIQHYHLSQIRYSHARRWNNGEHNDSSYFLITSQWFKIYIAHLFYKCLEDMVPTKLTSFHQRARRSVFCRYTCGQI